MAKRLKRLTDAVQGARHDPITVTWGIDLTAATITGTKRPRNGGTTTSLDGSFVVSSPATAGIFVWTPGAGDVGTAGAFDVQFKAQFTNYAMNIEAPWMVHPNQGAAVVAAEALLLVTAEQRAFLDLLNVVTPTDGQVLTYDTGTGTWRNEGVAALSNYLPLAGGTLTGQLLVPAGSAAIPSIGRDGAASTGIFIQAASIAFTVGGLRRGYVAGDYIALERDGDGGFLMGSNGDILFGRESGGDLTISKATALTNAATPFYLQHTSSGVPAAGFGLNLRFQGKTNGNAMRDMARVAAVSTDSNDLTRKNDLVFYASDHAAEREGLRVRANGSVALLITNLPTSSPGVTGALWNDGGTVKVSA